MHNIDIYIYVYGRTWLLEAPPSQDAKLRDLLKVDDIRKLAVTATFSGNEILVRQHLRGNLMVETLNANLAASVSANFMPTSFGSCQQWSFVFK